MRPPGTAAALSPAATEEISVVDFPLRGEWVAAHTPAERVPSHGTDQLGQRFAYDFVRIDTARRGWQFFPVPLWQYLLFGVRLERCYGWSSPIHAPFAGTVIRAEDGWPERKRLHQLRELALVVWNAFTFNPGNHGNLQPVLGNHIVLKMDGAEVYAFFAHARCGSIRVRVGDNVRAGERLAEVGHSGNSTAPHMHFHLMDRADILTAQGLPCHFREYEAFRAGTWQRVVGGMPARRELVRHVGDRPATRT